MVTYRIILLLALVALCTTSPTLAATPKKPAPQQVQPREERPVTLTVLSIIPAQGEPGMRVILNGSGFSVKTTAFLGGNEVPTTVTDAKQLSFDIPEIPPGLYALFLKREDGYTSKPYNFTLMPQKPVAVSLAPEIIYNCATGKDREVLLHGKNFQDGAQVLFNGAAIGSRFISPETLAFMAPQVNGGLHQVQVKNPAETTSGTLALFIDSKPEIRSVAQGEEFVNYYELIIEGRNFQQGSTVVVDGSRLPVGTAGVGEREKIIYGGCTRLIYQRHPYDASPKSFLIQILNPNGEESQVVSVNAP